MNVFNPLRDALRTLAHSSVQRGCSVNDALVLREQPTAEQQRALQWMSEQALVGPDGFVEEAFVSLRTRLRQPERVTPHRNSRYGVMKWLQGLGWRSCATPGQASLDPASKAFYAGGSLDYLLLLHDHEGAISAYHESFTFYHNQTKGYYECLMYAMANAVPCLHLAVL